MIRETPVTNSEIESELKEFDLIVDDDVTEDLEIDEEARAEAEIAASPFAFLMRGVQLLDHAWQNACKREDFEDMITVIDRTLLINDRYMTVVLSKEQEANNGRSDFGFGFQA